MSGTEKSNKPLCINFDFNAHKSLVKFPSQTHQQTRAPAALAIESLKTVFPLRFFQRTIETIGESSRF